MTTTATNNSKSDNLACVFCASSDGNNPIYAEAARELGSELVKGGYGLVYGGGTWGLMGHLARSVHEAKGKVLGVMPRALTNLEGYDDNLGEMVLVDNMHERKSKMEKHASAFIALPGGFGTFEELLEIITWSTLSIHRKPIIVLDTNGYYSALKDMITKAVDAGFIASDKKNVVVFCNTPAEAVAAIKNYTPLPEQPELSWEPKVSA
ncbi:hypothetical protein COEREDRAFT_83183 [Coemansia reversa NRRL 1564]|uniref:Cytokinin riboside 5'-monophosphate phosphoribohydrolase n=1 Tax=Coemansia reversa (strain ATCC 12441 / NRRL 1564) TaxID=763665 RepID=A0A2G5B4I4_COERN|nr:hypothetical protein COEREDRAFT_83183 [Coemansia reversa NRRL 1564]|eukprot:PIA13901.1 hypothetical protein COEREDRAFT_83183 [Coemansia reversa NRRL 1564]